MSNGSSAAALQHVERRDPGTDLRYDMNFRMQPTPVGIDDPWLMCRRGQPGAANVTCPDPCNRPCSAKHRMAGMRMAFAASGGLRSVGELAQGTDLRSRSRFTHIARWIATREIIGFMWHAEPWVPMFQFEAGPRMQPRRSLQPLFEILVPLYDAWTMANWFARPNQYLSGHRPVDEYTGNLSGVMDVAHLEHFIATGQPPHLQTAAEHRAAT